MGELALIVEGDGDEKALPIIVRSHLQQQGVYSLGVARPINAKGRGNIERVGQLERWLQLAARRSNTTGILVVCDADDDPACEFGPSLTERSRREVPHVPVRCCLAVREFENWIAASAETLAPDSGQARQDDFEHYSALRVIRQWKAPRSYVKTLHQPSFAAGMDHSVVAERCPSFARLLRCIDELVAEAEPSLESGA